MSLGPGFLIFVLLLIVCPAVIYIACRRRLKTMYARRAFRKRFGMLVGIYYGAVTLNSAALYLSHWKGRTSDSLASIGCGLIVAGLVLSIVMTLIIFNYVQLDRAGGCPRCGYPRFGRLSSTCPECGFDPGQNG
jgi:tetrahydromethanopterin S-methyltransferase subunit E